MVAEHQAKKAHTYLVRLQVRTGKPLDTDAERLTATVWDREVSIISRTGPLSKADWLVMQARGFPSEADASEFGERLRLLVLIAGLCSHLGIDPGRDKTRGQFTEAGLRVMGFEPGLRAPPEIHGISVVPDDGKSVFIYASMSGSAISDPAQLLGAVEELSEAAKCDAGEYPASLVLALRLLNLAIISDDRRAKIVLAISAIEGLIQSEKWSTKQRQCIADTVTALRRAEDSDLAEIADRLQGIQRISIRQGVTRLLDENGRPDLRVRWDEIYGQRSKLFHGGAQVGKHELNQISQATGKLCVTIVLSICKNKGIELPEIAEVHFPDLQA